MLAYLKICNTFVEQISKHKTMAKFKKGDRVRNLVEDDYVKEGATGTIDENNSQIPFVKWDSSDMLTELGQCEGRIWPQIEMRLEPIEESPLAEVAEAAKQYIEETKAVGGSSEFSQWQEPHIEQQPQEPTPLYGGKTEEWWLWHYAGQAMEGLLANHEFSPSQGTVAPNSISMAQALIEELKKQKQ